LSFPKIQFPQGPLIDPQTQRLSLEWFMFIQNLNNGLSILTQQMSGLQGFASTMLNTSDDDGADSMMGTIPGPAGQTGARGSQGMPGMDGQDADDMALLPAPTSGLYDPAGAAAAVTATSLGLGGGLTQASTSTLGKSITVVNGIVTAFA